MSVEKDKFLNENQEEINNIINHFFGKFEEEVKRQKSDIEIAIQNMQSKISSLFDSIFKDIDKLDDSDDKVVMFKSLVRVCVEGEIKKLNESPGLPKLISKSDLKNKYSDHLTVGELKKHLDKNDLPDDAIVLVERVRDSCYETGGWGVYLRRGYGNRDEEFKDDKALMDQYHPAWSCVKYDDESDILFIALHQ